MLYEDDTLQLAADEDAPSFDSSVFDAVADLIYKAGGFDINQIKDPAARKLILETVAAINKGVDAHLPTDVPDTLRYALEENGFIFSGFKTFHAMREIGLSMVNDKGEIKQYAEFQADVIKLNAKYNTNYLYAEYKHAIGTCQMAAKWVDIERDGDRYLLQYRTAEDDRVRHDHAAMNGITLPPSDPFWSKYYPPNGWGCRCTAVQVRRGKYNITNPTEAMRLGDDSTAEAKQQMFRFNPGKQMRLFPPKHPYYPKGCADCTRRLNLAYNPRSEKCKACQAVRDICHVEMHKGIYEQLKGDRNYRNVEFDQQTGGLRADHIGHNFDKKGGVYEKHVQAAGYKAGHAVIFGDESSRVYGERHTEGTWDGLQFEVAGRETGTVANIKRGLEHCADKRETQIAVLDFPNGGFSLENFNKALRRYKGLEKLNDGQFVRFVKIICVQNSTIVHVAEL